MKTFFARIMGKLLGDGTITKERGKSPRFQFTHHVPDYEWTIECYDKLKTYISFSKPAYRRSEDPRLRKGYSENYFVRSRVHPIITELYDIWYPNGQKIVPFEWMTPYFTDETLAWWYQDDGHLKIENGKISKIVLSTDSFTSEENEGLIHLLHRKYGFTFRLDGQNRIVLYERFQCIRLFTHRRTVHERRHASENEPSRTHQAVRSKTSHSTTETMDHRTTDENDQRSTRTTRLLATE